MRSVAQRLFWSRVVIAQLTGTVARSGGSFVVLDVNGVGYRVNVPLTVLETLPATGDNAKVTLITHTQVREDDISLFGFADEMDLRAFELLISVSGVGPKVALGLLSALTARDLAEAIEAEDVRRLTKVPGVGAKTAQRMVLELKEKFALLGFEQKLDTLANRKAPKPAATEAAAIAEDVTGALLNLGYNKAEAEKAVHAALTDRAADAPPPEFKQLLRTSLNRLTGAK